MANLWQERDWDSAIPIPKQGRTSSPVHLMHTESLYLPILWAGGYTETLEEVLRPRGCANQQGQVRQDLGYQAQRWQLTASHGVPRFQVPP